MLSWTQGNPLRIDLDAGHKGISVSRQNSYFLNTCLAVSSKAVRKTFGPSLYLDPFVYTHSNDINR